MELKEKRTDDPDCSKSNILVNSMELSLGIASIVVKNLLSILNETTELNKKNMFGFGINNNCLCDFPKLDSGKGRYHKWHDHFYCSSSKE